LLDFLRGQDLDATDTVNKLPEIPQNIKNCKREANYVDKFGVLLDGP
jgi:hypothetical protein